MRVLEPQQHDVAVFLRGPHPAAGTGRQAVGRLGARACGRARPQAGFHRPRMLWGGVGCRENPRASSRSRRLGAAATPVQQAHSEITASAYWLKSNSEEALGTTQPRLAAAGRCLRTGRARAGLARTRCGSTPRAMVVCRHGSREFCAGLGLGEEIAEFFCQLLPRCPPLPSLRRPSCPPRSLLGAVWACISRTPWSSASSW